MNYTIEDLQKLKEVYLCGFEDDDEENNAPLSELARFEIEPFLEWLKETAEEKYALIKRYDAGEFRYERPKRCYFGDDEDTRDFGNEQTSEINEEESNTGPIYNVGG